MSDYGEYRVTVQTSYGEKATLIVHAHSDLIARELAKQATGLHVPLDGVERVS